VYRQKSFYFCPVIVLAGRDFSGCRNAMFKRFIAVAAAVSMAPAFAAELGWVTDFEAAKSQAAAEHKDLLIDFTGSDWCVWCQKLDKEVFSQDAFAKVKEKYVLVQLDYPRDKTKLSGFLQTQNEGLMKTYPIKGYPTVLLCDATGAPYAMNGYEEGGPDKYVTHLEELQGHKAARDEAFAKAAQAEGVEKAKILNGALNALDLGDKIATSYYMSVAAEIRTADPKDETGFIAKENDRVRLEAFLHEVAFRHTNVEATQKYIAEVLADPKTTGEFRQMVHGHQAASYAYAKRFPEAIQVLQDAVKEDPEGSQTKELQDFIGILEKQQAKEAEAAKTAAEAKPAEDAKPADAAPAAAEEEKKAGE